MQKNIYSLGTVLFLGLILFFAGCSKEESGKGNGTDKNAIAFDCLSTAMSGTKTTTEDMQYFRVSAVWNKGNSANESFMNNQLVEKFEGNWVYSPIKHWPSQGTVSFFAHSPATSSGLNLIELDTNQNRIFIEYEVSDNYLQQEDFMVATNINQLENPVKLKFEHALSSVKFRARSSDASIIYRIKEIKLANIYSRGIITEIIPGESSTWEWFEELHPKDYVVYQKYPFETQGEEYREVGSLMLLPQTPDTSSRIMIAYDIVGTTQSDTLKYKLDNDFVFKQGKRYIFNMNLGAKSKTLGSNVKLRIEEEEL